MKYKKYLLAILVLVIGLFFVQRSFNQVNVDATDPETVAVIDNSVKNNTSVISDLQSYYNNKEIVGLLNIDNTDKNIVVVQGQDNKEYLNKDLYKNYDKNGTPFLDYRVDINNDNKLLIYGHNSNKEKIPFTILENYYDIEYFKNHQFISLITDEQLIRYQIFSIFVETDDWSYMKIKFADEDDWLSHLQKLKNKSMYETGVSVNKDDQILILQTCSHKKEYANYNYKYLLVIARKVG